MAKMKFDVKQFMMQKGERVGLGVALGLMALLVLWGIVGALSARSPAQDIAKAADSLTQAVNRQVSTIDSKGGDAPPAPGGKGGGFVGAGGFMGPGGGTRSGGGTASDKKYKEILVPVHALVVSATYPVKEQLELIRKALRYNSVKEMFESGTGDAQPEFGGLTVVRRELSADGKVGEWLAMKLDDPAGPTMKLYEKLKGFEPE